MLKSYFIDQLIPFDGNSSPVDAISSRFSLPDFCIVSYIAIPPQDHESSSGNWVTLFQDQSCSRFELALLGTHYLGLIAGRYGNAVKRQGLDLVCGEDVIGSVSLAPGNMAVWASQISVSKSKSGYAMRVSGKSSIPVPELSIDVMQTFISDFEIIKGSLS